jgi:hypothetical protein
MARPNGWTRWTGEMIAIMRREYRGTDDAARLSAMLGVSPTAVEAKGQYLGLTARKRGPYGTSASPRAAGDADEQALSDAALARAEALWRERMGGARWQDRRAA